MFRNLAKKVVLRSFANRLISAVLFGLLSWLQIVSPTVAQTTQTSDQPSDALVSTLQRVIDRGFLVCGATGTVPGFAQRNDQGQWIGFDVDFCRAVAAATLGDANAVEFRALAGEARFAQLQTFEVDLLVRDGAWTLARDTQFDVRYLTTSFFDGMTFLVRQDLGFVSAYLLDDLSICVADLDDDRRHIEEFFFETQAQHAEVVYQSREDLGTAYSANFCDAVAAPASLLQAIRRGLPDPAQHRIMPELISKAPFGPVVRDDDEQWMNIVQWVYFALINAEELGVSSANVESMQNTRTPAIRRLLGLENDFGSALGLETDWASKSIAAVGNYREIYDRNFGPQTGASMLRGLNSNWTQGGLLYAPPLR